jgi:hypothetical protein
LLALIGGLVVVVLLLFGYVVPRIFGAMQRGFDR